MKINDALSFYRGNRQDIIDYRNKLVKQKKEIEEQMKFSPEKSAEFSKQAASLELSIKDANNKFDDNQKVLDSLTEQYYTYFNAQVAKQQASALEEAAVDEMKIIKTAQRIANGDKVPAKDEQKVMEYSMELYLASKNAAMLKEQEKRKEDKSLWDDEEEKEEFADPDEVAGNALADLGSASETEPDFDTGDGES